MSNLGWKRETRDFYKTKCYEKEVRKVSKEMNLKSGKEVREGRDAKDTGRITKKLIK